MRLRGSMCTGNREDVVLWEKLHTIRVQGCVCVSDKLAAEGSGGELLTPCPVQSLLQDSVLIPAEGLKLSAEGTSQADMDADRSRSQASLPSRTQIFSDPINLLLTLSQSLDLAFIWYHDSSLLTGLLLRLFSGGHSSPHGPCWSGLEAMLWFQQQLTRPVRIRSVLKKAAVCGGRAGGWQLSVGEWKTRLQEGLRDREGGCNQRAPWEEEKISEIQTNKYGKEWNTGELGPGRQGWRPRLCMNNQMSHIVSWVRLRWSPGFQGPSTIMRELMTQGRNFLVSPFHGQFPRKISLQCHWSNLHPLGIESPWHTDKEVKSRCGAKSLARF